MNKKMIFIPLATLLLTYTPAAIYAAGNPSPPILDDKGANQTSEQVRRLQRQIEQLESALAPRTPLEAVETWAKGVMTRNGALQYAMMDPKLKEASRADLEQNGWVTGVSSPWIEGFQIVKETLLDDGEREYEVHFPGMTSTGPAGVTAVKAVVKRYDDHWYLSAIADQQLDETSAPAKQMSPALHYTDVKFGYSLTFPREWDGKYGVDKGQNSAAFYMRTADGGKVFLFLLEVYTEEEWAEYQKAKETDWGNYRQSATLAKEIAKQDGYVYTYIPASGNALLDGVHQQEAADLEQMKAGIPAALASFQAGKVKPIAYSDKQLGFSVELPRTWEGMYEVRQDEKNRVSFYYKPGTEEPGWLFSISTMSKAEWDRTKDEVGPKKLIEQVGDTCYIYTYSLDIPYSDGNHPRETVGYALAYKDIQKVISSFHSIKG